MTFQEEKIADLREEIEPILEEHWEELANYQDVRDLDIDWDNYYKLNDLGFIKAYTVRVGGQLVGYAAWFIANHLHYKTWKCAKNDIYYLHKDYRQTGLGGQFFLETEAWLKEQGVQLIVLQDKVNHSREKFLTRLGYTVTERNYEKII